MTSKKPLSSCYLRFAISFWNKNLGVWHFRSDFSATFRIKKQRKEKAPLRKAESMKFVLFVKEFRVLSSSVGVRTFFKEVQVDVGLISVEITRQHLNGWYHKEINPYSNGVLKDCHLKLQPNVLRRCTEKSTGALYVHNDSCIKNSCFDQVTKKNWEEFALNGFRLSFIEQDMWRNKWNINEKKCIRTNPIA